MDITLVLRGIILGFSIAAPVGPIGMLCIRRTLAEGRLAGLACGLGAATADAFYGAIAAFGITALSSILIGQVFWLRLIGGLFLCYMGIATFRATPAEHAAASSGRNLLGVYAATAALTLTNPLTILSFAAILAGVGVGTGDGSAGAGGALVLGVFAGSALWWLLLSGGVSLLRGRLTTGALRWINRLSGMVLLGFGLLALVGMIG